MVCLYNSGDVITNKDYYEQLLPAGGNTGQYAGVLGDQDIVDYI
jgi:hypothetical protein